MRAHADDLSREHIELLQVDTDPKALGEEATGSNSNTINNRERIGDIMDYEDQVPAGNNNDLDILSELKPIVNQLITEADSIDVEATQVLTYHPLILAIPESASIREIPFQGNPTGQKLSALDQRIERVPLRTRANAVVIRRIFDDKKNLFWAIRILGLSKVCRYGEVGRSAAANAAIITVSLNQDLSEKSLREA